ncbi:YihY/virulence factor BrkB family protein [Quisquiliibacterium transsilvanicum]|uniref:Membrane protein n=1 Tax=Quisquiliibacterium transsilvanicum TaxID=1549638 RepID=A0A7W8HE81_9BURK|nr:YihY/virulence factor BrkB family protein [Quisquiliibacterium transsilvanicum]MBB5270439.1 membrane protein [Quisquiliibacterium transsilvanicum]
MLKQAVLRWWGITRDAVRLWLDCNAFSYAGSLAFYTLFSLAPVVIIAVSVIGLVLGEEAAQGQIVAQLQDVMGRDAALAVEQTVASSRIEESGLLPTVLGLFALLVGATTVFGQMQYSLNSIWGVAARPDSSSIFQFLKSRLLSLAVVLSIGFVLLVSLLLGVTLRAALHFAHRFVPAVEALLTGTEFVASAVAAALLFGAIFKMLPDVVLKWRDVAVGAAVTALMFSVGRYAIAAYLAYTATASAYGAAGSVVLILLWVYYSSLILLFGAAFTKVHLLSRGRPVVPRNSAVLVRRELMTGETT